MKRKNLIISAGDPGGIGAEIILKSLSKISINHNWKTIILGDYNLFKSIGNKLSLEEKWDSIIFKEEAKDLEKGDLIFIDFKNVKSINLGKSNAAYGKAAAEYLQFSLDLYKKGLLDALVTAPICKKSFWQAGYKIAGHTHFLAKETKTKQVTMSMLSKSLKVFFVTDHIPFCKIIKELTPVRISHTIKNALKCLSNLGYKSIKLGICSVNPHAGEEGIMGKEEEKYLLPLCEQWRARGFNISGPLPPEVCFKRAAMKEYQGVIALYHNQGMIPFKLLSGGKGINVTLGLPFLRVSPEHGTAFDIADKFIADESSMINAINFAIGNYSDLL